jgi:hypothetical protein
MALEDKNAQHYGEVVDKYNDPEVSYQMTTRDYVLRPQAYAFTGLIVITLPPVAEAKGRFYSIIARRADVFNTITITDKDDSECWLGDIVLDNKCDRALLYSDGLAWIALAGSPGAWPGASTTDSPATRDPGTTLVPTTSVQT